MDDDVEADDADDSGGLPDLSAVSPDAMGDLLEQAQKMMEAQQAASEREIEGVAGGGMVRVRTTGTGEVHTLEDAPDAASGAQRLTEAFPGAKLIDEP